MSEATQENGQSTTIGLGINKPKAGLLASKPHPPVHKPPEQLVVEVPSQTPDLPSLKSTELPQTEEQKRLAENTFSYKGIRIEGVHFLEEKGILKREDIITLLDRLPQSYFDKVPLTKITFQQYKIYSVERGSQVMIIKENEILPDDQIIARKRGITNWNQVIENGTPRPTDGGLNIEIFSPVNWDEKNDPKFDKDTALYSLAHELGHSVWGSIVLGPNIWEQMVQQGTSIPEERLRLSTLIPAIKKWNKLEESQLQRYQEYKSIFLKENQREKTGYSSVSDEDLAHEEDFAIAHEYYLYWQNLESKDLLRAATLDVLYEVL